MIHGTDLPGRCTACGLAPIQGHRATSDDGLIVTGCTPSGPVGLAIGRHLASVGMARTVEAHPDDAALVDAAIAAAAKSGREFSANDLRYLTNRVEAPAVIGARMRAWVSSKKLRRVGDVPSDLPGTHGHKIGRYVRADAA